LSPALSRLDYVFNPRQSWERSLFVRALARKHEKSGELVFIYAWRQFNVTRHRKAASKDDTHAATLSNRLIIASAFRSLLLSNSAIFRSPSFVDLLRNVYHCECRGIFGELSFEFAKSKS